MQQTHWSKSSLSLLFLCFSYDLWVHKFLKASPAIAEITTKQLLENDLFLGKGKTCIILDLSRVASPTVKSQLKQGQPQGRNFMLGVGRWGFCPPPPPTPAKRFPPYTYSHTHYKLCRVTPSTLPPHTIRHPKSAAATWRRQLMLVVGGLWKG